MTPAEALARALRSVDLLMEAAMPDETPIGTDAERAEHADAILAALPEGAALVTRETLAEALHTSWHDPMDNLVPYCTIPDRWRSQAAAIIEAARRG